jgi:hypothetical protein
MSTFLSDFKADSKCKIKLETICGDFNTDPRTDYDDLCRKTKFFKEFKDTLSHTDYGTCTVEETTRDPNVSTPQRLKKALQVKMF